MIDFSLGGGELAIVWSASPGMHQEVFCQQVELTVTIVQKEFPLDKNDMICCSVFKY